MCSRKLSRNVRFSLSLAKRSRRFYHLFKPSLLIMSQQSVSTIQQPNPPHNTTLQPGTVCLSLQTILFSLFILYVCKKSLATLGWPMPKIANFLPEFSACISLQCQQFLVFAYTDAVWQQLSCPFLLCLRSLDSKFHQLQLGLHTTSLQLCPI